MLKELLLIVEEMHLEILLATTLDERSGSLKKRVFRSRFKHYLRHGRVGMIAKQKYKEHNLKRYLSYRCFGYILFVMQAISAKRYTDITLSLFSVEDKEIIVSWLEHLGYRYEINFVEIFDQETYSVELFLEEEV